MRYMKVRTIALLSGAALVTLLLAAGGCQATRAGYETAPYRVIESDGAFQVRDYPAMQWVETSTVAGDGDPDGSFGRLFRFITGGNQAGRKIAMTTPVYMTQSPGAGDAPRRVMAFVMPRAMAADAVPAPSDPSVRRREMSAGRFVVLRFRGGRSTEREAEVLAKLRDWTASKGFPVTDATPIYGYFDPPWTPTVFRRNEVMLRAPTPPVR